MKKLLSCLAVFALLLGLSTAAGATDTTDKPAFDTSVFEAPQFQDEDGWEGIECWEPVELGISHNRKSGITYYQWLNKIEKIPAVTEENGGCFVWANLAPAMVVFWNGVPNLSKDLFKYWEDGTNDVYIPDSVTEIDEDAFVMNSTITLHFSANNAVALAYAEARGMNYEIVPEPEEVSEPDPSEPDISDPDISEPSEPDISDLDTSDPSAVPHGILLGDADGDGDVTMKDVLLVREFIANMDVSINKTATDLNGDGSTDMKDVLVLRKTIAHAAA
ncbi:MAG: hypothetical protein IKI63_00935 [Clostridia bacterium]|nr:hypothetical protein [Clostridia bacterium]